MKKPLPDSGSFSPNPVQSNLKPSPTARTANRKEAIVKALMDKHELSELEASWLLEAWELAHIGETQDRFACYLAGFMAGIALKTVEQEIKSGHS